MVPSRLLLQFISLACLVLPLFLSVNAATNTRLREAQDDANKPQSDHLQPPDSSVVGDAREEPDDPDLAYDPEMMPPPMRFQLAADVDFDLPEGTPLELVECFLLNNVIFIQIRRDWSPLGAERFVDLVEDKYYDQTALFRAIPSFLVQFGVAADEMLRSKWRAEPNIRDDPKPPKGRETPIAFEKGMMSFAGSGKDSRGTQVFFTLIDGERAKRSALGREPWETPFGKVVGHVELLDEINTQYGDAPQQSEIWREGYAYLEREFPELSYIDECRVVSDKDIESILRIKSKIDAHDEL